MEKRFKVHCHNNHCYQIKDKFDDLPIQLIYDNYSVASAMRDWLNENCDKKRFELKHSHNCFRVWDNIKKDTVRFRPFIETSNVKGELQEWVDFLNKLWEENSINE